MSRRDKKPLAKRGAPDRAKRPRAKNKAPRAAAKPASRDDSREPSRESSRDSRRDAGRDERAPRGERAVASRNERPRSDRPERARSERPERSASSRPERTRSERPERSERPAVEGFRPSRHTSTRPSAATRAPRSEPRPVFVPEPPKVVAEPPPLPTSVQTVIVTPDENNMRVDRFLEHRFPGLSFSHIQRIVRKVPVPDHVTDFVLDLVRRSRPDEPDALPFAKELIAWGPGPRACQQLILGGKVRAILRGRFHVTIDDIQALAYPVLRHRIVPTFNAEAEGVRVDQIIKRILDAIPKGEAKAGL